MQCLHASLDHSSRPRPECGRGADQWRAGNHHRGPMGGGVVVTGRSPQLCAGRARTQAAAARPSEARVDGAITELCFTTNASCKHFSHPWFSINYLQNIYTPLQFLDFWGQSVSLRSDIWCIDKRSLWVWFSRRGLEGGRGIINYISLNCSIVSNWKYLKCSPCLVSSALSEASQGEPCYMAGYYYHYYYKQVLIEVPNVLLGCSRYDGFDCLQSPASPGRPAPPDQMWNWGRSTDFQTLHGH